MRRIFCYSLILLGCSCIRTSKKKENLTMNPIVKEYKKDQISTKYDSFDFYEVKERLIKKFRENLYKSSAEHILKINKSLSYRTIEELTSKISFLPLETTDECLIGRIGEIIELENYYLIGSMEMNEIFYYNHVYLFDKIGRAHV